MIKRIRFATRRPDVDAAEFPEIWRSAGAAAGAAPPEARPVRIAVCTALPEVLAHPKHDGIGMEWFADVDHLDRFERWLDGPDGQVAVGELGRVADVAASPVVIADEEVRRGADWLERRWRDGGAKLKHMAIAVRAPGLTPSQFSARWEREAGRVGAVPIPEDARGLAYVQNHPRARATGEWAYDALNEVYFDDLESLHARVAYLASALDSGPPDELFSESWFVVAREEVAGPGPGRGSGRAGDGHAASSST